MCVAGHHVTLVAHSLSVKRSLEAADELAEDDIKCEVGGLVKYCATVVNC